MGFKKWNYILNRKVSLSDKEIFGKLPPEFSALLKYTKNLTYQQCPNYSYMKSLLAKFIDIRKVTLYFDWLNSPKRPKSIRNHQIVEGATRITILKREKRGEKFV